MMQHKRKYDDMTSNNHLQIKRKPSCIQYKWKKNVVASKKVNTKIIWHLKHKKMPISMQEL